jgi:predicted nucleic acid-binding protein
VKRYLLDTTILAAGLFRRRAALELLTPLITRREAATSILVYGELIEHIHGRPDFAAHRAALRELLREVSPYFLTYSIVERYAEIRRQMRRSNSRGLIGDVDTLIAALALERNLTVISTDADFERVPGLKLMLVPRRSLEAR